ncbi:MAG: hypothetical protein O3C49_00745, partial [Proteobacteria bacterium]|nr:hypothetical protein [Pseudomonadota bacterium]
RERFVPLRNRIFDISGGGVGRESERVFREESWIKVIIRGSLVGSNRTDISWGSPMNDKELLEWAKDDPRSELQPLLDLLVEDDISGIIHMYPTCLNPENDAVTTRPTYPAITSTYHETYATRLQERLLFDETGRWGFFASEEEFGLLGGEPTFMERYIERVGGMEFIREKADAYWQRVLDVNGFEARSVANYYRLAGWDNPPTKKD